MFWQPGFGCMIIPDPGHSVHKHKMPLSSKSNLHPGNTPSSSTHFLNKPSAVPQRNRPATPFVKRDGFYRNRSVVNLNFATHDETEDGLDDKQTGFHSNDNHFSQKASEHNGSSNEAIDPIEDDDEEDERSRGLFHSSMVGKLEPFRLSSR